MDNNKKIVGFFLFLFFSIIIKMNKIELALDIILNIGIIELLLSFYNFNEGKTMKNKYYIFLKNIKSIKKISYFFTNSIPFIIGMVLLGLNKYYIKSNCLSKKVIMKLLFLTSINDTLQEFFGNLYGKTKVTKISPNKTLEGYLGSYVSMLFMNLLLLKKNFFIINLIYFGNIIGDLFFSYIKRLVKIKDYSNLLGSHGGILDRFDSFLIPSLLIGLFKVRV